MAEFQVVSDDNGINTETVDMPVHEKTPDENLHDNGQDIQITDPNVLVKETIDTIVERSLAKLELEINDENKNKALAKLSEKLQEWVEDYNFDLDIDVEIQTKEDIKKALMRKGLDDTAKNIKALLEGLDK